jgi:hypothetical protein
MRGVAAVVVVVLLALTGCGKGNKNNPPAPGATGESPTATASAGASGGPTPTGSPAEVIEFSVDGAGPYLLGSKLAELQTAPGLEDVKTGGETCPQNTTARGTGTWHDIYLSFRPDGTLYLLVNRSAAIPTPSGAYLGTPLAQLKTIYAGISGTELSAGPSKAYLVTTVSGRGILFTLDSANLVFTMVAGDATYLKTSFTSGTDFC